MGKKRNISTIAAALAALPLASAIGNTTPTEPTVDECATEPTSALKPDVAYQVGDDLLGLVVTKQSDGTVVAQHTSHVSHASHASHQSHYSSR